MSLSNGNVAGDITRAAGEVIGVADALTGEVTVAGSGVNAVVFGVETAIELGQAMHELAARQLDLDEFRHRFLAARIYTLCPVRPGLFVMSLRGGAAIVPVWTTVRALRHVMGNYDWCARTGEDLVDQLPAGVGVLIDGGMPHSLTLPQAG